MVNPHHYPKICQGLLQLVNVDVIQLLDNANLFRRLQLQQCFVNEGHYLQRVLFKTSEQKLPVESKKCFFLLFQIFLFNFKDRDKTLYIKNTTTTKRYIFKYLHIK